MSILRTAAPYFWIISTVLENIARNHFLLRICGVEALPGSKVISLVFPRRKWPLEALNKGAELISSLNSLLGWLFHKLSPLRVNSKAKCWIIKTITGQGRVPVFLRERDTHGSFNIYSNEPRWVKEIARRASKMLINSPRLETRC